MLKNIQMKLVYQTIQKGNKILMLRNFCITAILLILFSTKITAQQVTINFNWVASAQTDTTADFEVSLQNTGATTLRFNGIIIRGNHAAILTGGLGTISWASVPGTAPTTVTSGFPWTNYDPVTNPTGGLWPNLANNLGYTAVSKTLNYSSSNVFFTNLTAPTIPTAAPITIGRFRLKVSGGTFIPNAQFGFIWAPTAAVIAYVGTNTTTTSLATAGTNKIVTTSVNQPLNPIAIGTISGDSSICAGSSANINVAINGGNSPYTLIYGNGTNSFTVNNYISGSPIAVSPSTTSTYTITSVNGYTLNHIGSATITVNSPSSSTNTASVCANALPYIWNTQSLTSSGVYTHTTLNAAGCDSVSTLNFTVLPASTSTSTASACANALPYIWNSQSLTSSGVYTHTTLNAAGCDSVDTLNFTVLPTSTSTTTASACANALPYIWNTQSITSSGVYTDTSFNAAGCDSVATLNFTVLPNSTSTTTASACANALPYIWNTQSITSSGVYTHTTFNAAGCDSVATLNFTVLPTITSTISASACANALPYIWNTQSITSSGVYTDTTFNATGCDSVTTLNFTVLSNSTSTTTASACANALPYIWNTQSITSSGVYTYTTLNAAGCDSVATLNFTTNTNNSSSFNPAIIITTTCPTVSGGSVIVSATTPSTFTISPVGPLQPSSGVFTSMIGGTNYIVTLTDANSCTNTTMISATSPSNGELAFATAANASSLPGNFCGNMLQTDGSTMNYYAATCDDLIATVNDTLGGNILGSVNACVTVLPTVPVYNSQPYLPRMFDITPTNQGPATITLYFTQDDFDDYNAAAGSFPQIPASTSIGTASFSISQVPGGFLPGSSGATTIVHNVTATWNAAFNRWEVNLPVSSFSGFYAHATNPLNVALPAAIANFKGIKTENSDVLTWTTTSELNNAAFTVLYSNDGKNYTPLTTVNSKATSGNSNVVLNYNAENLQPKLGHNYYKLEQIDIDGKSLINTQVVDLIWGATASTISVYPNPTSNELNIDIFTTKAENSTIKILDMSGRILKEIQTKLSIGANSIHANIGEFATGIYTLQIFENNKITQVSKVEKK